VGVVPGAGVARNESSGFVSADAVLPDQSVIAELIAVWAAPTVLHVAVVTLTLQKSVVLDVHEGADNGCSRRHDATLSG
jgi:hypothetical protein